MQIQPIFHNVAETESLPNLPGLLLQRYPRSVREKLNNSGRQSGMDNSGVEIRFKTNAPQAHVTVTCHAGEEGEAVFYKGPYEHSRHKLAHGVTTTIALPYVATAFDGQPSEVRHAGGFSTDVWRICIQKCAIRFHHIDTFSYPLLPIEPGDTPSLRWLAYGSSITHAWLDGYAFMAAKLLQVDVFNKGLSGGCHAEPEAAEFLSAQDWDFMTAELGINMIFDYSPEAFEIQVRRFLGILRAAQPGKPIVLISPYRNGRETTSVPTAAPGENLCAYRDILTRIHAEANDSLLTLIDGNEILNRVDLLRLDLVHPATHGHALMGMNLSRQLQPLVDSLRVREKI